MPCSLYTVAWKIKQGEYVKSLCKGGKHTVDVRSGATCQVTGAVSQAFHLHTIVAGSGKGSPTPQGSSPLNHLNYLSLGRNWLPKSPKIIPKLKSLEGHINDSFKD